MTHALKFFSSQNFKVKSKVFSVSISFSDVDDICTHYFAIIMAHCYRRFEKCTYTIVHL